MNPDHIIIGLAVIGFAAALYLLVHGLLMILDDEFFEEQ